MEKYQHAFDIVAAYFSVLSEPTRLRIMNATCEAEKTVTQIVEELEATQTNISRHLNLMYRADVLARRKVGNQVYYMAADPEMVEILREVCVRLATKMDEKTPLRADLLRVLPKSKKKKKQSQAA